MAKSEKDLGLKIPIGTLIEQLTPLNNAWRDAEGRPKLEIMWEIGDQLVRAGVTNHHPVAWAIQKRSYITRDLLSYSFMIRRQWRKKEDLRAAFPNLKSYSACREAFPFILGKYQLPQEERQRLIAALNRDDPMVLQRRLRELKRQRIGIKHDRRQGLEEIKEYRQVFVDVYGHLKNLIFKGEESDIRAFREQLGDQGLVQLAQLCMALSEEGVKGPQGLKMDGWPSEWEHFAKSFLALMQNSSEKRNRFRRAVGARHLLELADWLNSLRSEESVRLLRLRMNVTLSP